MNSIRELIKKKILLPPTDEAAIQPVVQPAAPVIIPPDDREMIAKSGQKTNPFTGFILPPAQPTEVIERPMGAGIGENLPVAEDTTIAPNLIRPPRSQEIQSEMNRINEKSYSKPVYDELGNLVKPAGADRDKKWSLGEKFAGFFGTLADGGNIFQAGRNAADRNYNEKRGDRIKLGELGYQYKQAAGNEEFQTAQNYKKAQLGDILRRPEKEREAFENKLELATLKQIGDIQKIIEKDRLAGKKYKVETRSDGRLVKKYPDREEPFLNERGEQEYNLLERPEATQVEDGVNADGTKKYKTVYMKGGQYANLEASKNYRDAMIGLSKERLSQQESQFNRTLAQRDKEFQANFVLAQTRVNAAVNSYNLAVEKFNRGDAASKEEMDRLRIGLTNSKKAIMSDSTLTAEEKAELIAGLPSDL